MNMNILEQEDLIKGAPDDLLLQEAQSPTGRVPQFLVVSEIQRRKSMRDRFSAQEQQPEQSVAEQIVAGAASQMPPQGIGALQPQMPPPLPQMPQQAPVMAMPPPQMPPEMMAAQNTPMAPPPQMMAAGGGRMPYQRMNYGGVIPPNALVEDASKFDSESLNDMRDSEKGWGSPTDMGIPKVIREAAASSARDAANIRNIGFDGKNITGRGSFRFPNGLRVGASGYAGLGGAGITGLDASKELLNNRFIQGQADPLNKSFGLQFGGSFSGLKHGGIVKMVEGEQVEVDPTLIDKSSGPGIPLNAVPVPADSMAPYLAQQQVRYDELKKFIEETNASDRKRQEKDMLSTALMNIGAGIGARDLPGGLAKAGASVLAMREKQSDREKDLQLQLMKNIPGGAGSYTDLPSSVREYQYFMSLSPEEQARFLDLKRQNYEIAEINGRKTIVRKVGGVWRDQNNNPVIPDAGTVTSSMGGADAPEDGEFVSATDKPEGVLWGGVDKEGKTMNRSYVNSPIFLQPLETIQSLAATSDYKEDRQLLRDLRREREEGAGALKARLEGQITTTNRIESTIKRVLGNLSEWSAGSGSLLKILPGTEARTMQADLNLIRANLAFDRLQQMRNSSPTGGALGQVSELELKLLESAMASVDQGLDPEEFRIRLNDVSTVYSQLRDKSLKDYAFAMATTTNPTVRAEYDTQMQFYQGMIDGKTPASEADKETAQKILNEYNSILEKRGTQGLQGGGMVSVGAAATLDEDALEYKRQLERQIQKLNEGS